MMLTGVNWGIREDSVTEQQRTNAPGTFAKHSSRHVPYVQKQFTNSIPEDMWDSK